MKAIQLNRSAQYRANSVNVESRTAEFVISTEAVDSYGTVFKMAGWDLTRYNQNPVVTYNHSDHSDDPDIVIGTSEIRIEDGKMIATLTFENFDDNPLAGKVFRKIQNGILRGASISAWPFEARYGAEDLGEDPDVVYFTRQELVAWSVVTLPSNAEALVRSTEEAKANLLPKKEEPKPEPQKESKMSRFEAQSINNQNKFKCENL